MRYIYTFLLAIFALNLGAQELVVTQDLRPLITKRTATWCIHCGTWGWNLFEGLLEDNSDNASLVTAHFSGALKTDVASSWTDNLAAIGQPRFYVGNVDQGVTSGNINDKRIEIEQEVLGAQEKSPLAQTGLIAASENDSLEIEARVKFFDAIEGEFYLGVYLVQKEVMNTQTGQNGMVTHHNVLQAELNENWYGDLLANGAIEAGTTFDWSFSDKLLEGMQRENLRILTVIWQKNESKYEFVNSNMLQDVAEGVLVNDIDIIQANFSMTAYPNPASTQTSVELFTPRTLHQVQISLWNTEGRQLQVLEEHDQIQSRYNLQLDNLSHLAKGQYFIRLTSDEIERTVSFLKQ